MLDRFAANRFGRDFVCGDIHGGWRLLEQAMARNGFEPSRDRLFCVGDLIDRGPDCAEFPEWLSRPWFFSLFGNHEQMALRALCRGDGEARLLWIMNGGDWIHGIPESKRRHLLAPLARLPLAIEIEGFGDEPVVLTHAGLPGNDWPAVRRCLESDNVDSLQAGEPVHSLLWDRQRLHGRDDSTVQGALHLFHGHTVVERPVRLGNSTWLDTGSVMTGRLTMMDISVALSG